jgi:hypothetical protein
MTHPRTAALAWIRDALTEELREHPLRIAEMAEVILAIAEDYSIPVEEVVRWIHMDMPRRTYPTAAWVLHCNEHSANTTAECRKC